MLQAGFGRLDITPPLGTTLAGYYKERHADGILDPLLATAVLFDNGEKKALAMSIDLIGFNQFLMDRIRTTIAERMGMDKEGVFLACTHTHLSPCTASSRGMVQNEDYIDWLEKKLGGCRPAGHERSGAGDPKTLYLRSGAGRGFRAPLLDEGRHGENQPGPG